MCSWKVKGFHVRVADLRDCNKESTLDDDYSLSQRPVYPDPDERGFVGGYEDLPALPGTR